MTRTLEPRLLVLCPLAEEFALLRRNLGSSSGERIRGLGLEAAYWHDGGALLAVGGHGKTEFAVHAQYLIGRFPSAELVICTGAAGSLVPDLTVGDIVVGIDTVEHDYRLLFATRSLPRFPGHRPSLAALRPVAGRIGDFRVVFDTIASGDEDVVTAARAREIRDRTGAACVAWEGSGAARAARFSGKGSLEIRAVTDAADGVAPLKFGETLPQAMANLASLLRMWLSERSAVEEGER